MIGGDSRNFLVSRQNRNHFVGLTFVLWLIAGSQVGKKLERDKRLDQEASRHWEEISLGTFQYDR
jgi:hypothetical protein